MKYNILVLVTVSLLIAITSSCGTNDADVIKPNADTSVIIENNEMLTNDKTQNDLNNTSAKSITSNTSFKDQFINSEYFILFEFTVKDEPAFTEEYDHPTDEGIKEVNPGYDDYSPEKKEEYKNAMTVLSKKYIVNSVIDKVLINSNDNAPSVEVIKIDANRYEMAEPLEVGARYVALGANFLPNYDLGVSFYDYATYRINEDGTVNCVGKEPLLGEEYEGMKLEDFEEAVTNLRNEIAEQNKDK